MFVFYKLHESHLQGCDIMHYKYAIYVAIICTVMQLFNYYYYYANMSLLLWKCALSVHI